jgi:hypothetical protein
LRAMILFLDFHRGGHATEHLQAQQLDFFNIVRPGIFRQSCVQAGKRLKTGSIANYRARGFSVVSHDFILG